MSDKISLNRRKFLSGAGAAVAGSVLFAKARVGYSKEIPELKESDPMGKAFKYVTNPGADAKKRVNARVVGGVKPENQFCNNCSQFVEGKRLCKVIPNFTVQEGAWCSVWVPLATKK